MPFERIKSTTKLIALAAAMAATSVSASPFGGLGGFGGGSQSSQSSNQTDTMSPADLESHYSELNHRFDVAMIEMLIAQSYTVAALGDKQEADKLKTQADSLNGVNDLNTVSRSISVSQDASAEIDSKMAQASALDGDGRANLAQAVPHYGLGMVSGVQLPAAYADWAKNAQHTADRLKSNPMNLGAGVKLGREVHDVTEVTTHLPALIATWTDTTHNFIKFSQKNKVDTGDLSSKI
jgi:hypothetical protein